MRSLKVKKALYFYKAFFIDRSIIVENTGVEPITSCVQGKRSGQMS